MPSPLTLPHAQYDQYEIEFTHYKPLDDSHKLSNALKPPKLCKGATPQAANDVHHARKMQALSVLPSALVPGALNLKEEVEPTLVVVPDDTDWLEWSRGSAGSAAFWLLSLPQRIASWLGGFMGGSSSSSSSSDSDSSDSSSNGSSSSSSSSSGSRSSSTEEFNAQEVERVVSDRSFIRGWNAQVGSLGWVRVCGEVRGSASFKGRRVLCTGIRRV